MPEDLILPTKIKEADTRTEPLGNTIKEMTLLFAANGTPGVTSINLAPLDESGAWMTSAFPTKFRRVDNPNAENVLEKLAGSAVHSVMMNARINLQDPATAAFAQMVQAAGGTVTGNETVKEFAKLVIPLLMVPSSQ